MGVQRDPNEPFGIDPDKPLTLNSSDAIWEAIPKIQDRLM